MSVPLVVVGEPVTVGLKMIPSPAIPTLVTVPGLVTPFETNRVLTSVTKDIALLVVMTVAMGMLAVVKPVVLEVGVQLFAGLR